MLTQDGGVTAAGGGKGQGEKGEKRTGDGGVRVSGTDYPWEAINLPRESDTPTAKQTPGESSPLLTSSVFFFFFIFPSLQNASYRQSGQTAVSRGACFKYQTSSGVLLPNTSNTALTNTRWNCVCGGASLNRPSHSGNQSGGRRWKAGAVMKVWAGVLDGSNGSLIETE